MEIHWCLKGMRQRRGFDDKQVREILTKRGIESEWYRANSSLPLGDASVQAQGSLSDFALDQHVNAYGAIAGATPFISLTAGCIEAAGSAASGTRYPALLTAMQFATAQWRVTGYIFRCWVLTAPRVAAALPGLADEVRDLNLFPGYNRYHRQGEITAKLFVPYRQIQSVQKIGRDGRPMPFTHGGLTMRNNHFVDPASISNLVPEIE